MKNEKTQINYHVQKLEGLQGILYRLKMIYYIAYSIKKPNHLKGKIESDKEGVFFALQRAPLESFLIHIRALNEFIVKLKCNEYQKDDLRTWRAPDFWTVSNVSLFLLNIQHPKAQIT